MIDCSQMAQLSQRVSEFQIIKVIDGALMGSQCVQTDFSMPFSCATLLENSAIPADRNLTLVVWAVDLQQYIKKRCKLCLFSCHYNAKVAANVLLRYSKSLSALLGHSWWLLGPSFTLATTQTS